MRIAGQKLHTAAIRTLERIVLSSYLAATIVDGYEHANIYDNERSLPALMRTAICTLQVSSILSDFEVKTGQ